MRIAILGFGREGKAVLKYLKKNKAYKNAEISILDKSTDPDYLGNLASFDLVFRSPGIPYNSPEIQKAIKAGVRFSSATKIFFDEAPCRVIGITGTKGKGTTSTLLYNILKAAKRDVSLAGNIGRPAIEILPKLKKSSVAILELSSFQLHDLGRSPQIGVVLDIFPDHLDSHDDFADYFRAKSAIARYQKPEDKIFYIAASAPARKIGNLSQGKKIGVAANFNLFSPADLKIPGGHNFQNAIMAASVAAHLGIPKPIVLKTVKNFRGLPHRLELSRTILIPLIRANKGNDKNYKSAVIKFYNDSASTNPQTTAAAIRAFSEPMILIAGGKDKNLDYTPLAHAVRKSKNLKGIILFGENKNKIKVVIARSSEALRGTTRQSYKNIKIKMVKNLKSAIVSAFYFSNLAIKQFNNSAINIIFSPGAASFDMFRDYADRGEKFREIVKKLK